MSWGSKIAVVFFGFVIFIIGMVTISMKQKDIHLVTEKYYEKEIAYQEQIDHQRNTLALKEVPLIAYIKDYGLVKFTYPDHFHSSSVSGTILFFRPSDARKDFTVPVKPDEHPQEVSVTGLEKGLWKIKMEWTSADKTYYLEEKLVVL